jgi:hypothetical protein
VVLLFLYFVSICELTEACTEGPQIEAEVVEGWDETAGEDEFELQNEATVDFYISLILPRAHHLLNLLGEVKNAQLMKNKKKVYQFS